MFWLLFFLNIMCSFPDYILSSDGLGHRRMDVAKYMHEPVEL